MATFDVKSGAAGQTRKATFVDANGLYWDTTGTPAFEVRTAAKWSAGDYFTVIGAVTDFPGDYTCTIPAAVAVTAGARCEAYLGAAPALGAQPDYVASANSPLIPTVAGRTLNIDAGGIAEVDLLYWRGEEPQVLDGAAVVVQVQEIQDGAITAASIANGAIDTATFATGTTIPRVTLTDTTTDLTNGGGASVEDILEALASTTNFNIIAPATGSTIDLFKGDSWAAGRTITITESGLETHWPTTLSTVHFWARPDASAIIEDSAASDIPASVTFTSVACSGTTATGTLPSGHGLTTGVHAIRGANEHEVNGYRTVTISVNTATWTMPLTATVATATGTIKIQPGIACTVTQSTGSAQAFTFAPTAVQLQRLSTAKPWGYDAWFVANAVTDPAVLRGYAGNAKASPVGT